LKAELESHTIDIHRVTHIHQTVFGMQMNLASQQFIIQERFWLPKRQKQVAKMTIVGNVDEPLQSCAA
jgi:hypothetical protein